MDYFSLPVGPLSSCGIDEERPGWMMATPYSPTNWQFDPLTYSSFQHVFLESGSHPNADFEFGLPIMNPEPAYNPTPPSQTLRVLDRLALGSLPASSQHDARRSRNRLAAQKYRRRKQLEVEQLKAKAQNLSKTKEKLQACHQGLQDEIFRLKSELLQHARDCHYGGSILAVSDRVVWSGISDSS